MSHDVRLLKIRGLMALNRVNKIQEKAAALRRKADSSELNSAFSSARQGLSRALAFIPIDRSEVSVELEKEINYVEYAEKQLKQNQQITMNSEIVRQGRNKIEELKMLIKFLPRMEQFIKKLLTIIDNINKPQETNYIDGSGNLMFNDDFVPEIQDTEESPISPSDVMFFRNMAKEFDADVKKAAVILEERGIYFNPRQFKSYAALGNVIVNMMNLVHKNYFPYESAFHDQNLLSQEVGTNKQNIGIKPEGPEPEVYTGADLDPEKTK